MTVIGFALLAVIGIGITRSIYRPLRSMTQVMQALAQGDRDVEIPGRERGDEVGLMAGAVQVFKDALVELAEDIVGYPITDYGWFKDHVVGVKQHGIAL